VDGLRRCELLKFGLEVCLRRHPGIIEASASIWTGNVLIRFRSELDYRDIAAILQEAISRPECRSNRPKGTGAASPSEGLPALAAATPNIPWPFLDEAAALKMLGCPDRSGLTDMEAGNRLRTFGPNVIPDPGIRSSWRILLDQLVSLPMMLVCAETALAAATAGLAEAGLLTIVVAGNLLVGYLVERHSREAVQAFTRQARPAAEAIRDGRVLDVPGEELVPGDLILLKPGTYVGADSRIIEAAHLKIDESSLTGESIPAEKFSAPAIRLESTISGNRNMAYMGTLVVGGEGLAVVTATGSVAEYGRLHVLMEQTRPPSTLVYRQLQALSDRVMISGGILIGMAAAASLLRGQGPMASMSAVLAMAAGILSAGLPSASTVSSAVGVSELRGRVSIRRLNALETLGGVGVVCFDKTGTITRGRITVLRVFAGRGLFELRGNKFRKDGVPVDPLGFEPVRRLIEAGILCNESRVDFRPKNGRPVFQGSPTEKALLFMGFVSKTDISGLYRKHRLLKVRHRGEYERRMITVHSAADGSIVVSVKGDPMEVLSMCSRWISGQGIETLTEGAVAEIESENDRMAADALRVLGFAFKIGEGEDAEDPEKDLVWIGLAGMAEPIRKGVGKLMERLHASGIKTVMITGDQNLTAAAVAGRIRLAGEMEAKSIDSSRFDFMDPRTLEALTREVHIYSRVNPAQKLQIVQAYQKQGHIVAMTGDGINDGPALKAADIGVAMGLSGTDVAREVADIVLEHDDLPALWEAIQGGRIATRNLKKAVSYFLTTNLSEILVKSAAVATGFGPSPAAARTVPLHGVTDMLPGLALLREKGQAEETQPPRHSHEPLLLPGETRDMNVQAAILAGGAMAAYGYGVARYGAGARSAFLAFETLTAAKLLHALIRRSETRGDSKEAPVSSNPWIHLALGTSFALQLASLLIPGLRQMGGIPAVHATDLVVAGACAWLTRVAGDVWGRTGRKADSNKNLTKA
jgi:Ca2+-transporting ATPase